MSANSENTPIELMAKDPANWKGLIYFNKKDSRIIVPKLYPSFGWTFNMGNIYSYVIIAVFLAVVAVLAILPFVK